METYAYSASKAAVHQLTRHLASCLAPNVTVNAIAPGPFESKMMRATLESLRRRHRRGGADEAHRPALGHGRRGHLPGLPGRQLHHGRGPARWTAGSRPWPRPALRPSVTLSVRCLIPRTIWTVIDVARACSAEMTLVTSWALADRGRVDLDDDVALAQTRRGRARARDHALTSAPARRR